MVNILVTDWPGSADAWDSGWPTHAISIHDVTLEGLLAPRMDNHIIQYYRDVDDPSAPRAPTMRDMEELAGFVASMPDDANLLVHCHRGRNRSTAAAILALMAKGSEPRAAWDAVLGIRPMMMPNRAMIGLIDGMFGCEGGLVEISDGFWDEMGGRMVRNIDDMTLHQLEAEAKRIEHLVEWLQRNQTEAEQNLQRVRERLEGKTPAD